MRIPGKWGPLAMLLMGVLWATEAVAGNVLQGDRNNSWSGTPEEYNKPWKESISELPLAPSEKNLTMLVSDRFDDDYEYVIDRNSTSLRADKVFRYTVVVRAPSGVKNGFYEGINCETRAYKTYGILTDSGFQKSLSAVWKPMRKSGVTIFRLVLLDEYVCNGHSRPASLKTINARLDKSGALSERNIKLRRRDFETENKS